jgi:hypothetical protein
MFTSKSPFKMRKDKNEQKNKAFLKLVFQKNKEFFGVLTGIGWFKIYLQETNSRR